MPYRTDIDSRILFAQCVPIAQLSNDSDRVHSCVFCECAWDNFQGVCICLEAVSFHPTQCMRILRKSAGYMDLWRSSARNQSSAVKENIELKGPEFDGWSDAPFLDKASDDTKCIM